MLETATVDADCISGHEAGLIFTLCEAETLAVGADQTGIDGIDALIRQKRRSQSALGLRNQRISFFSKLKSNSI